MEDFNNLIEEGIDVLIRTLEFLGCLKGVNIDFEYQRKMQINSERPVQHGGKLL